MGYARELGIVAVGLVAGMLLRGGSGEVALEEASRDAPARVSARDFPEVSLVRLLDRPAPRGEVVRNIFGYVEPVPVPEAPGPEPITATVQPPVSVPAPEAAAPEPAPLRLLGIVSTPSSRFAAVADADGQLLVAEEGGGLGLRYRVESVQGDSIAISSFDDGTTTSITFK